MHIVHILILTHICLYDLLSLSFFLQGVPAGEAYSTAVSTYLSDPSAFSPKRVAEGGICFLFQFYFLLFNLCFIFMATFDSFFFLDFLKYISKCLSSYTHTYPISLFFILPLYLPPFFSLSHSTSHSPPLLPLSPLYKI